ncbi:hypothetical protein BYZ73_16485 [Rhodovulum viride]|uniref:Uncharacterized protein n=1 Tax=Rhodovulum viride TaxID=1231134 RepID=A0ABX9DCT0_9RHOB|nr:hypothetical protein [Rhodovulum viride]RAP40137.1 hypothetical protein BYZ73_16485 [Rhodovulum viride]
MIEATDHAIRTLLALLGALVLVWLRTDGMALIARMGIVLASGATRAPRGRAWSWRMRTARPCCGPRSATIVPGC